ncbi:MAG: triose-phosphate isomerase [Bacteriovoracia bacterium]
MKKRAFPKTKKLVVANWKMNPDSFKDAKKIFDLLKKKKFNSNKVVTVICPPYLFENELAKSYRSNKIKFGFQNVHFDDDEKSTGEISAEMAKNSKAEYVLVGHSERRQIGETNEIVSKKIKKCLDKKITPILCVGENERNENGDYLKIIKEQIVESLSGIPKNKISEIVIAYEPVWAVGKGKNSMDSHELYQMTIFIKKILVSLYDKKIAMELPILYGGSVDADNALELIKQGQVDGLLVGRSSLNPHVFGDILKKLS